MLTTKVKASNSVHLENLTTLVKGKAKILAKLVIA